ncbi:peptidase [Corallococcus sicarius]|uniref:Peptidase n=1 Tax=Corallococcus sicarius TaxID=2316726 RepID=A0A3A8NPX5_9BACT|nr:peptidase [Corallococcus sicarius]
MQGLTVTARDPERDVPTMVWARAGQPLPPLEAHTPQAAARAYLERHAALYRLSPEALGAAFVHRVHDTGQGGIIVFFRQRVGAIDVVRNELKVLMTRDLELVAITGSLHDGVGQALAEARGARSTFRGSPSQAVVGALGDLHGVSLAEDVAVEQVGAARADRQRFELAPGSTGRSAGISLVIPAEVRRVYFPTADRLVPAYSVELLAERAGEETRRGYEYVMDAESGGTLHRRNRISHDGHSYRVWADADGTPRDGPQKDFTPHPTGLPDETFEPGFELPRDISVEGRIHTGGVDPWLAPGATFTSGNNVSAYADHYNPDGYTEGTDVRALVSPGTRDFHYDYDTSLGALARPSQTHAAITSLFYTTNWLHDYFYASGFTEAAGNAQQENHGRGGLEGDALLAEAQNQGPNPRIRNNASIYVPKDGQSPRMEMYLWEMPELRSFRVASTDYATGRAEFGRQDFNLGPARLVLANDGTPGVFTGCTALTNDVTGAIVLADRGGGCSYELKAVTAQNAGAAGLIVLNHTPGAAPPDMFEADATLNPTLPVLSVSFEAGQALKALLGVGSVTGTMARIPGPERDGTIDNTIVAHEWGHLLHLRLVDCSEAQCGAQSEGWADFIALHMMVRQNDGFGYNGTYGVGGYAAYVTGDSPYHGIRRAPYSRDPTKNALRFRHISDEELLPVEHPLRDNGVLNSEFHNAGEIWASMLFDGYLALLDEARKPDSRFASFAEAKRRMADYVVAGMMLAPANPTFTEQRDALLMAARSWKPQDPRDMLLLAEAFARRGAGTCASAPPRRSQNFTEVKEGYQVQADLRFEFVKVDDGRRACDAEADGVLDAEEAGSLHLKVTNLGPVAATGVTLTVTSNRAGELSLPTGELSLPPVPPLDSIPLVIPIELASSPALPRDLELTLTPGGAGFCQGPLPQKHIIKLDHDLGSSTTDTVESPTTQWHLEVLKGGTDQRWQRVLAPNSTGDAANHVWFIKDGADFADTALITPRLTVVDAAPFKVTFDHRYRFAFDVNSQTGRKTFWTGGVIELTLDGGKTWEDVSRYLDPGYGGTLDSTTSNNLGGRQAYVAQNSAWPQMNTGNTLDFASQLSGKTVQLRFRFGSPWFAEAHGWEIDNITVSGVREAPFDAIVDDVGTCQPSANAGEDRLVESGASVTLHGSGSSTPVGRALTYSWRQLDGPPVELAESDTASPHYTGPNVSTETPMHFELSVGFGPFFAKDTVEIRVKPTEPQELLPPNVGGGGGCASAGAGRGPSSFPLWLAGTLSALAMARRRRARKSEARSQVPPEKREAPGARASRLATARR